MGGTCCFHDEALVGVELSAAALLASTRFYYGMSSERRESLATRLRINMLARRMPLMQARECGVDGTLLAYAGLRLSELLPVYLLEELLTGLGIDWPTLKALDFSPLMLVDIANVPLITLYDSVQLRGSHLFEYDSVSREALEAALGETGVALLRLNLDVWPSRVVDE